MSNKVKIDQLADAITDAIKEYTEDVSAAIADAVDEVANDCKNEIIANAPKRKGKYAKSWTVKKENYRGKTVRIIHAKAPHYRLAHLLEKGHAKRGGGRVAGRPHIAPAEQNANKNLLDMVESIIRKGGK